MESIRTHINDKNETRINKKEVAQEIVNKVKGKTGSVTSIENEEKKNPAPFLYDLTELQRDCNRKYGLSAQKLWILFRICMKKKNGYISKNR